MLFGFCLDWCIGVLFVLFCLGVYLLCTGSWIIGVIVLLGITLDL